eukprot:s481_g24.t1
MGVGLAESTSLQLCCPDGSRLYLQQLAYLPVTNTGDGVQVPKDAWVEKPQRIACGFYHSAAISRESEAWVWGRNQYNVHGQKSKSDDRARAEDQDPEGKRQLQPKRKGKFGNDIHEVHCGTNHTVFLKKNQSSDAFGYEVYTTGLGNQGRLGVGPGSLSGGREEDDQEMVELDIWWSRSGAIKTMFPWTSGTRALHIACGADHTLCLATDGHVYAWGVNSHGQCGTGSSAAWHRKPMRVHLPKDHAMVSHMAAGAQHSLAIIDGVVFSWGNGRNGRLGTSQSDDCRAPMDIEITHENRMAIVAGGEAHRSLFSCGSGAAVGHLVEGERRCISVPVALQLPSKVIAAGMFHSMALLETGLFYGVGCWLINSLALSQSLYPAPLRLYAKEKGLVYSWGVGAHGRLGHGNETTLWAPKPLPMPTEAEVQKDQIVFIPHDVLEDTDSSKDAGIDDAKLAYVVAELSCGSTHAFARTHGGFLYGWGCDSVGQLGFAGELSRDVSRGRPQLPTSFARANLVGESLPSVRDEELWSWGRGFEGQLGLGHCRDANSPCQVPTLDRVQTVAAGEIHSAAIVQAPTGLLYTWGSSDSGVLGLGQFITSGPLHTPTKVNFDTDGPQSNVLLVRCGANSTAVVCGQGDPSETENTLWTFGNGWYGRLGLGSQESHSRPARVKLPKTGVRELSLGVDHAAAITLQDELFLWGKGSLLGEVQNVLQPKRFLIEGSSHFKLVVCGELETFLVDKAGHLLAWGSNRYGQLGLGQQSGFHVATPSHVKPLHEPVTDIVSGGNFTIASLESGDVCAWGNQTCGRLGLVETKDERICWEPSLVVATWSTVATAARPQQSQGPRLMH